MYFTQMCLLVLCTVITFTSFAESVLENDEAVGNGNRYKIEGTVSVPHTNDQSWFTNTRIMVNGGQHLAFLR